MKTDKQKTNWLIDAGLFGGFLGALWLDLTGVAAHQWLGLAVAAAAGYHLWKHWRWVEAVTSRFFGRTSSQSRTYYIIDAAIAAGLAAITATGMVISTWLDLSLANYAAWHTVHVAASVVTLGLLVVKIGLHWRWIIDVARRRIFSTPAANHPAAGQPAAIKVPAQLNRRDFVRLTAGVGAVALLSGVNAVGGLAGDTVQASAAATPSATSQTQATASAQASNSCVVTCNRGCSYPGRCHRYIDSNGNERCDLGECAGG